MVCSKCNIDKDISNFYKNRKDCKLCKKEYDKKYHKENSERMYSLMKIYKEQNYDKIREYNLKYQKSYQRFYYDVNKEDIIERIKNNYQKNKKSKLEYQKKYNKLYFKERMKNDPLFKLSHTIRVLIYTSFKRNGYSKKSKTFNILKCEFEYFVLYIESQFKEGMSWENHGEWHLDHKIPSSWARSEDDVYMLNHYTNFQPLWAFENIIKGNKYEY